MKRSERSMPNTAMEILANLDPDALAEPGLLAAKGYEPVAAASVNHPAPGATLR